MPRPRRGRFTLLAVIVAAAAAPLALGAAPDPLAGRWTFNADADPTKQRCAAVAGKLLAALHAKTVACDLAWATNSASGKAFISCKRQSPQADYMLFKTRADCEAERQTQAANGD